MPWICGKCGGQTINVYRPKHGPEERQCSCGNITIQGVTPRWPITYQESHKEGCEAGRLGTEHPGEPQTLPETTDAELVPAGDPSRAVTSDTKEQAGVSTGIGLPADRHTDAAEAPASAIKSRGGKMSHRICESEGCEKQVVRGGLCFKHYGQKHGVHPRTGIKREEVRAPHTGGLQPQSNALAVLETIEISAQLDYDRLAEAIVSRISADVLAHAIVERIYLRLTTKHIVFKFNGSEAACQG